MRIALPLALLLLPVNLAGAADPADLPQPLHWQVNGEKREAIVLFPDGPRKKPAPVIFVFHGHGSRMQAFARHRPLRKYWPEAIAVYMQGLPTPSRVDPKGTRAGWQSEVDTHGNRDLKFFDAGGKHGPGTPGICRTFPFKEQP